MIRFRGTEQLDALAGRLREAPRRLTRELESGMSAAARPAAKDVRSQIKSLPMGQRKTWSPKSLRRVGRSLGKGSSPLRAPIAAAVQVRSGVAGDGVWAEIELRDQQVPARARWLLPYVVGRKSRLRHPFMGNRKLWVQANASNMNRWWPVIERHIKEFTQARDRAVRRVEDHLGG